MTDPFDTKVAREIGERARKQMDQLNAEMWQQAFGGYTTSSAPADDTLTLDKLNDAYEEVMTGRNEGAAILPGWTAPALCCAQFRAPTLALYGGLPVYTSRFLGDSVTPEPPPMRKGPYLKRRIKRWRRAHPPYTVGNGQFLLVHGREIWCHPDDFPTLQHAVDQYVRPADLGGVTHGNAAI